MKKLSKIILAAALCAVILACSESKQDEQSIPIVINQPATDGGTIDGDTEGDTDEGGIDGDTDIGDTEEDTDDDADREGTTGGYEDSTSDVGQIILAIQSASSLIFYDGEKYLVQDNESPVKCGTACYTDGDVYQTYSETGDVMAAFNLVAVPDLIQVGEDTIELINVEPADAYAQGALYRDYTKVIKNNVEVGHWYENQYKANSLLTTLSGDQFVFTSTNRYLSLNNNKSGINHAEQLLIYNFSATLRTARIADATSDSAVTWSYNFFNQAKQWLLADSVWYSQNGYSWNGSTLTEQATAMWSWNSNINTDYLVVLPNGEKPVVIKAGTRVENSETVTYWIECNSGWVVRYVPSVDRLETAYRIYSGTGMHLDGINRSQELKPVIIDGKLYYTDGAIFELDLDTGVIVTFFATEGIVTEF